MELGTGWEKTRSSVPNRRPTSRGLRACVAFGFLQVFDLLEGAFAQPWDVALNARPDQIVGNLIVFVSKNVADSSRVLPGASG
jgi:hypothetical protein